MKAAPNSLEAEQQVLGAMILSAEARWYVAVTLANDDFYHDRHRVICKGITAMPEPVDEITLAEYLKAHGELERCGGLTYLTQLTAGSITVANIEAYCQSVKANAIMRRLQRAGMEIAEFPGRVWETPEEAISAAADKIMGLALAGGTDDQRTATMWLADLQRQVAEGDIPRVRTGLEHLDALCILRYGQVTVLAGATSGGKTASAMQIGQNVATLGQRVYFWSGEMDLDEIYERMTATQGNLDLQRLQVGKLEQQLWDAAWKAANHIDTLPITIDDKPRSVQGIESRCRAMAAAGQKVDLLIVDYLALLNDLNEPGSLDVGRRDLRVGWVLWRFKQLARALKLHVLALHQFNRESSKRQNSRPRLSDLRDSSQIEQHANRVWLTYMPQFDESQPQEFRDSTRGLLEIIIAKQRQGPKGNVWTRFLGQTQRIATLPMSQWPKDTDIPQGGHR